MKGFPKGLPGGPVLAIWDGPEAGAVLVDGAAVLWAGAEERLSRREGEWGWPSRCLIDVAGSGVRPSAAIVVSGDPASALYRLVPAMAESARGEIRREGPAPGWPRARRALRRALETMGPGPLSRAAGLAAARARLAEAGFRCPVFLADRHAAHAAAAAAASAVFPRLLLTLGAPGDGASGSAWRQDGQGRSPVALARIPAADSLALFLREVSASLGIRETRDGEGIAALAPHGRPPASGRNPLSGLFEVTDGPGRPPSIRAAFSPSATRRLLRDLCWSSAPEDLAALAQDALECWVCAWADAWMRREGVRNLACAGGLFANAGLGMALAEISDHCAIAACPGDGGLALGAAAGALIARDGMTHPPAPDLRLGAEVRSDRLDLPLVQAGGAVMAFPDVRLQVSHAADLLAMGEIVAWAKGRAEIAGAAPGSRCALARPDDPAVRDRRDALMGLRPWGGPPRLAMTEEAARDMLEDYRPGENPHGTRAHRVRPECRSALSGAIDPRGLCVPQVLGRGHPNAPLRALLREMGARGLPEALLVAGLRPRGEPVAETAEDALRAWREIGINHIVVGQFAVARRACLTPETLPAGAG